MKSGLIRFNKSLKKRSNGWLELDLAFEWGKKINPLKYTLAIDQSVQQHSQICDYLQPNRRKKIKHTCK